MERIGKTIQRFLHDFKIDRPIKNYQAINFWSEVVGEKISQVTEPKRLNKGKIFVEVKSDVWRNELVYHKPEIISNLNKKLGSQIVEDIILI